MSKKFLSGINVTGTATLNSVANAGGNTNKFLVLESDGSVKYRTSSETAGDIGAVPTGRQLTINGVTYDLSQNRAWTISTGSILNSRTVTEFTATAGQTTFNLTYNPNGLEVFYNGSNLDSTEYTATNGTSIVLTNACNVGDVVKVISLIDGVTVSGVTPISFNSANGQISIQQASGSQDGYLSSTDWTTFNNKVSTSRTLTINGTAYDLSADRSWSIAPGGTAGQILSKNSATDYDWSWIENFAEKIQHSVKLGEAITKGQAVYVAPSGDNNSTNMTVMKASNATEATSSKTMGLVAASGVLNDFVRVITEGLLSGLDTSTANQGDPVWLGTNGNLIFGLANKPVAPAHLVFIGIVTRVNQNNGEIFVKVQNGFELNELHNVLLVSEANNQALVYESSTGLWKNKTLSTSWITEGTNLYYTDARVGSYLTTNSYATQTYVTTQIANLVNSAPTTLDTLNELATALGNDPNFATTIATSLGGKEPTITAGTTTQYWRGDKTWQTLPVYTLSGLGGVPTSRTITINGVAYDLSADRSWSIAAGVTSFNTRTGAITLSSSDVTTALGFTPYNATNPNGYISSYTETSTLAQVTARGATSNTAITLNATGIANSPSFRINTSSSTSFVHTQENFAANLVAGQRAMIFFGKEGSTKNAGGIGYYWAGAGSNSNFITLGHWGNDDIFRIYGDSSIQTASYLRTSGATTNTVYWSSGGASAAFGNMLGDGTASRTAMFRGSGSSASVWWGGVDGNGTTYPFGAIDATPGEFTFWRNSGGTGGGSWTKIMTMNDSGLSINSGNFIGNLSGTLNGYNTAVSDQGTTSLHSKIPVFSTTGNLSTVNPESYSGEVRLGAAWSKGGVYASSTLSMSTSSGAIDFVSNQVVVGAIRWSSTLGSRHIIGEDVTTTPYTLIDTNKRPVQYLRGAYPVLVLDHTETTNTNHGPTIQFVHNGFNARQWVIGTNGTGTRMDFGFSSSGYSNTNYNPHNGIAGYTGKTLMRITETGVLIGGLGSYPTVNEPSYPFQVNASCYISSNIDTDGSLRFNASDSRRMYGASLGSSYNAIRCQGNWETFDIMGRVLDWTGSNLHFGDGYNGESHSSVYFQIGSISYFRVKGSIYADGDVIAYYSDRRLKQNIKPIEKALGIIDKINAYTYEWNKLSESVWSKKEGDVDFGLISQEVESVWPMGVAVQSGRDINDKMGYSDPNSPNYDPLHVEDNKEEYKTVKYDKMVALAIAAIKELKEENDELRSILKRNNIN